MQNTKKNVCLFALVFCASLTYFFGTDLTFSNEQETSFKISAVETSYAQEQQIDDAQKCAWDLQDGCKQPVNETCTGCE
jgi:hypothetical protein